MTPEAIREQIETAGKRARDIAALAEQEKRDFTAEERGNVKAAVDQIAQLNQELKALKEQAREDAELRRRVDEVSALFQNDSRSNGAGAEPPHVAGGNGSPGQRFVENAAFQEFMGRIRVGGGAVTNAAFGHSPRVVLNDLITLGGANAAGELVVPQQSGILVPLTRRPLTIRDVITVSQTASDAVEYVEVTTETNSAGMVAESTETADPGTMTAPYGVKPESAATFTRKTAPVRTIAHWVPATRQALADAGQLRTYIDDFLRDGLLQELEDQIIAGNGTGENFAGIDNAAGLDQTWDAGGVFVTTRKARTKLRTQGRVTPNAWLLNPLDFEEMELERDLEERFHGGGPFGAAPDTLWRVPIIEHEGVPENTAYLGNFRRCILWERSGPEIMVSDSHANFFIRNLVAILAEMRAAFAVIEPTAIIKVALAA